MESVCLDTHILIWGLEERASTGQEKMVKTAKNFIAHLDDKGVVILLPSVVVGEFLLGTPRRSHPLVTNLFQRSFVVPPYDLKAARLFAGVWQDKSDQGVIDQLRQDGHTRSEVRADCMIVATALAQNTSCVYSHDPALARFAEGYIDVKKMSEILDQLELELDVC